ncbi:MAG: cupin domain-containing protein, partial [Rhizobiaceae bacterium]|nr:cupin domain-containing protein [Rhizobiaceae bacterium]
IDTPDALLVAHKNNLDGLGRVVKRLVGEDRAQADIHLRVARPWGHYDVKADEPGYKVKCVLVQLGAALSSQYHYHRAEHWIVVKGTPTICCDGKEREVGVNESVFIPQGTIHRLENRTAKPLELVEVQTGDYLGEDDIVRLEDVYGRV